MSSLWNPFPLGTLSIKESLKMFLLNEQEQNFSSSVCNVVFVQSFSPSVKEFPSLFLLYHINASLCCDANSCNLREEFQNGNFPWHLPLRCKSVWLTVSQSVWWFYHVFFSFSLGSPPFDDQSTWLNLGATQCILVHLSASYSILVHLSAS